MTNTAAQVVYLLYVGAYDSRALVGVYSALDHVEREIVNRALRGNRLDDLDIEIHGVDDAEVPEALRVELDERVGGLVR